MVVLAGLALTFRRRLRPTSKPTSNYSFAHPTVRERSVRRRREVWRLGWDGSGFMEDAFLL